MTGLLLEAGTGTGEVERAAAEAVEAACSQSAPAAADGARPMCSWQQLAEHEGGAELVHLHPVRQIAWHARGDYFASVAPTGTDILCGWGPLCVSLLQEASSDIALQATHCCLMKPPSAAAPRMPCNVSGTFGDILTV